MTSPKNLKAIADPCQLLTPQQLQEIGASDPRPDKTQTGEPACIWQNDNLRIRLVPYTTQGMDSVYANRARFDNSEESTINGHPGIRFNKVGMSCGVYVGVADKQVFSADVGVRRDVKPEYKDRCAFAEKVAGMVLSNLPPAS